MCFFAKRRKAKKEAKERALAEAKAAADAKIAAQKVEEEKKKEPVKEKETTKTVSDKAEKPVTKKATTKKEAKPASDEKKGPTKVYHVSKREDGKWAVKFARGSKVIKLFDTQKEAKEYTQKLAENQEGVMLVHNSKGKNKGRIQ